MSPIKLIRDILKTESKVVKKYKDEADRLATTYYFKYDGKTYNLTYIPIKEEVEDYKGRSHYVNQINTGEMILVIEKGHPKSKSYSKNVLNLKFQNEDQRLSAMKKYGKTEAIANKIFTETIRRWFNGKSR